MCLRHVFSSSPLPINLTLALDKPNAMVQGPQGSESHVFRAHVSRSPLPINPTLTLDKPNAMVQGPQGSEIHLFRAHVSRSPLPINPTLTLDKPNTLCAKTSKGNLITRYKNFQPQVVLKKTNDNPNPPNELQLHCIRVLPKVPQRGMTPWV